MKFDPGYCCSSHGDEVDPDLVILFSGSEDEGQEEDEGTQPKSPARGLEPDSEDESGIKPTPVPLESESRKEGPDDLIVHVFPTSFQQMSL